MTGLPAASPRLRCAETVGDFAAAGQLLTVSGRLVLALAPFWPVKLPRTIPPAGAQLADSAARGPPKRVTTNALCGTSGRFENVTE